MSTPLVRRMEKLEALLGRHEPDVLTLLTDFMPPDDDPAPFEAAALATWKRNTGKEPPAEVRFIRLVLRGVKPDSAERPA